MPLTHQASRFLPYILYTVGFLCLSYTIEEDSYIYFRVAENIANGAGYVFNVGGEHIETGSSPLWQYLLALIAACNIDLLTFAKISGFFLGAGQIFLIQKISGDLSTSWYGRYLPALAYCLNVPFLWWTNSGLETPLYTFMLLLCAWFSIRQAPLRAYHVLAFILLFFSRPEAPLTAAALIFCLLFQKKHRQFAMKTIFIVGLAAILYEVFRIYYFHDLQISPFYAKIGKASTAPPVIYAYLISSRLIWIAPVALAVPLMRPSGKELTLTCVTCAALFFFKTNYDHKPFYRFLTPALPFLFLLAFLGLEKVSGALQKITKKPNINAFFGIYAAVACIAIIWTPRIPNMSFSTKLSLRNPIFSTAQIIAEDPLPTLQYLYKKCLSPLQPFDLDNTFGNIGFNRKMVGYNYQAQMGSFLARNYPSAHWIVYDQMGQTPYFAGPEHNFVDLYGLTTKKIGFMYFGEHVKQNNLLLMYQNLTDSLLQKLLGPLDRRVSRTQAVDGIFALKPEVILINTITAHAKHTLTSDLASDHRLHEFYMRRYWIENLITVYERRDFNYAHDDLYVPQGMHVMQFNSN